MPDPQSLIDFLAERILALQRQQDESAWNEVALIATLKELLPGFDERFAQLHNAARKVTSPATLRELEELVADLKKKKGQG